MRLRRHQIVAALIESSRSFGVEFERIGEVEAQELRKHQTDCEQVEVPRVWKMRQKYDVKYLRKVWKRRQNLHEKGLLELIEKHQNRHENEFDEILEYIKCGIICEIPKASKVGAAAGAEKTSAGPDEPKKSTCCDG